MLKPASRPWLIGGWIAVLVAIVIVAETVGAALSTTILLLALGVSPAMVMLLLSGGVAAPTVAEILHSVDTHGRSGRRR